MKQGNNPQKRIGLIAILGAILGGGLAMPKGVEKSEILQRRNGLLINFGRTPAPIKPLNQRQKRKRYRQSHHCT